MESTEEKPEKRSRINFRPLLFGALGWIMGVCLYGGIRFGKLSPWTFALPLLLIALAVCSASRKRVCAILLVVLFCMGMGVAVFSIYDGIYSRDLFEGKALLKGTVISVAEKGGYSVVLLRNLSIGDRSYGGKCRAVFSNGEIEVGDILQTYAEIVPLETKNFFSDDFVRQQYAQNIRYQLKSSSFQALGKSKNPFLLLNAKLKRTLDSAMEPEEASIAYALLTGNSSAMDEDLLTAVRYGGIAHIFAVSGLHIGILFGAVSFLFRPAGKYKFLPAGTVSILYCAFCNFSVSSLRAVLMCVILSLFVSMGKKRDFLDALSAALIFILLVMPAQWYSTGFRLSFGACLGIALLQGGFSRLLKACRMPERLGRYLSSNLSVQMTLFPLQMDAFGYFPILGILPNLIFAPFLPIIFLGLLLCAVLAMIFPVASGFLLALPQGALSLFLYVFSAVDWKWILTGFSLGAGAWIFLWGCVLLSQRIRIRRLPRLCVAVALVLIFTGSLLLENVVFTGCEAEYFTGRDGHALLFRNRSETVLVIDDEISLSACEDFLRRRCGAPDLVVVVGEEELEGIHTAAFLGADKILAYRKIETGLQKTPILFSSEYQSEEMKFLYLSSQKLMILCEDVLMEIDFTGERLGYSDLFFGDGFENATYFLKDAGFKKTDGEAT